MPFDYANPYSSTRIPVFARNVVATSHPLAVQAGLRMLGKGGNAVDAAIATAATMTVVEPVSNGLGSDSFCILWDGQQLHGLNASGRAPQAWTPDYFRRKYGDASTAPPKRGLDSVTVPGAVASWVAAERALWQAAVCRPAGARHRHCAPRLPAPAGGAAEMGGRHAGAGQPARLCGGFFALGPGAGSGRAVPVCVGRTRLQAIADTKGQAFYSGAIAAAMARFAAQHGASLTVDDFARYQPEWVTPIEQTYRATRCTRSAPTARALPR